MLKETVLIMTITTGIFVGSAKSQDISIMGMPLGKPFVLPQCPKDAVSTEIMCWQYLDGWPQSRDNTVLRILVDNMSKFLLTDIYATIRYGILDKLELSTPGIRTQDENLSLLTNKFGKPVIFKKIQYTNGFGSPSTAYDVSWNNKNAYVHFTSVSHDKFTEGLIIIETPRAFDEDLKRAEEWFKNRPKF